MMIRTPPSSAGLAHAVKAAALVGLTALAGCGFTPAGVPSDGDGGIDAADVDAAPSDGRPPLDGPPGIDARTDAAGAAFCPPGDQGLVLCLPFDDGTTANRAGAGPQPFLSNGVTPVAGRVGMAAGLGANSALWFEEAAVLDIASPFTIEMFVYYTQDPPNTGASGDRRVGLLDNDSQYSLFLGWHPPVGSTIEAVTPYCNANSTAWGPPASRNAWHHVACVHSGATLTVYVDGVPGVPVGATTAVSTGGQNGTTLGQNCDGDVTTPSAPLIGALDEVRVWAGVARTPLEIMAAAAR